MITTGQVINKQDYVIIKNVINDDNCNLLVDYALFKAKSRPNIKKNLDPLDNVHREYGDTLMELLLEKLTPVVEQALGKALWPTLSFYYVYSKGNELLKHKDRSSCQIVAGLCLGADEDYKKSQASWPLMLNINNRVEPIHLDYGDLLIFQGATTEHWRETFTGDWFVSAIFGYVEKNGPFSFQKFDQRSALGKPHIGMFHWALGCLKNKVLRPWMNKTR